VTAGWLTRKALVPILDEVDGVFMHTMTLTPGVLDLFARKPIVVSCDATPIAKRQMRTAYGDAPQLALSELAKRALYRQVFKRARGFVAWSHWAKESLVRDYGCRAGDVAVIPPGIDLTEFTPGVHDGGLPRILFVGGDFARKGGDLLLEVFRTRLRGKAQLVLVTRDPIAAEPGVEVHSNVHANSEQLRALYASCDVFALPTRADCYALACMEAMAAGLPIVSTRTGGIPDMVMEGITGYIIDVDDGQALARTLVSLVSDPAKRQQMARAARIEAGERFDANTNARTLYDFVRSRCEFEPRTRARGR
jgi:glycosyltransferase involved in cell wall biosynthesis